MHHRQSWRLILLLAAALGTFPAQAEVKVSVHPYHGWSKAFTLDNGTVQAVVVPEVGRLMQFKFSTDETGPFWENRGLDGKSPNSQSAEWINFGGDKTWPAPQGEWEKLTARGWPPPKAFDSLPIEVVAIGEELVLTSPTDPDYGIQTQRRIKLHPTSAEMEITTTYRKVQGPPVRVSVWVITQLKDPQKMYMPVARGSRYKDGYNKQSDTLPANLQVTDGILTCTRSPKASTKIGSDAGQMIWGDSRWVVSILAPREAEGEFPDNGSSAEIYTNPDPNRYVELETLGPLREMKVGDSIARSQTYRLYRRTQSSLDDQVKEIVVP